MLNNYKPEIYFWTLVVCGVLWTVVIWGWGEGCGYREKYRSLFLQFIPWESLYGLAEVEHLLQRAYYLYSKLLDQLKKPPSNNSVCLCDVLLVLNPSVLIWTYASSKTIKSSLAGLFAFLSRPFSCLSSLSSCVLL